MNKSNKNMEKAFDLTSRYIDDLISISNPRLKQLLKDSYPEDLVVLETSESRIVMSNLNFLIDISNGDLVCSILTREIHLIEIIWKYSNSSSFWYIHLTADKI